MTWFPVVVYRWVRETIRRVPAAILTGFGIDAPSDNGQEALVQVREDEEQQSPRQQQDSQEALVLLTEDEEQQSPRQRHNSQDTMITEEEEQQYPWERNNSQGTLALPIEEEQQHSPPQQQLPNGLVCLPNPHPYLNSFYQRTLWPIDDNRVHNVWPFPQPTNGPQQASDAADAADPGYSGNDAGQGQTGYRTPDTDSGYDSMG